MTLNTLPRYSMLPTLVPTVKTKPGKEGDNVVLPHLLPQWVEEVPQTSPSPRRVRTLFIAPQTEPQKCSWGCLCKYLAKKGRRCTGARFIGTNSWVSWRGDSRSPVGEFLALGRPARLPRRVGTRLAAFSRYSTLFICCPSAKSGQKVSDYPFNCPSQEGSSEYPSKSSPTHGRTCPGQFLLSKGGYDIRLSKSAFTKGKVCPIQFFLSQGGYGIRLFTSPFTRGRRITASRALICGVDGEGVSRGALASFWHLEDFLAQGG